MRTPTPGRTPRAARVPINEEFAPVEAFINEYVSDLSSTGVFVKSRDPLPVGTRVAAVLPAEGARLLSLKEDVPQIAEEPVPAGR